MMWSEQNVQESTIKPENKGNANQLPNFAGSWRMVLIAAKWSSKMKVAAGNRFFKSETDAARSSLCGSDTIVLLSSRQALKLG